MLLVDRIFNDVCAAMSHGLNVAWNCARAWDDFVEKLEKKH